ncbi:hypothetical protein PR048_007069 [Dryococelus australis]|uniref:Uncharacterized protein n=1 Tax=Dryococelus australis TaxID=614101 RepID=A0ABQ9ICK8_9NEOP|nr:hypothetical protein PR048_007069 [Dryococelus australis]
MKGRGKRDMPEKTRRPMVSSSTFPTCKNPVTRPGIEPGSPWWEASILTAQPPQSPHHSTLAQYSPSSVTADNQCAVDIGIFVRTTVESTLHVTELPKFSALANGEHIAACISQSGRKARAQRLAQPIREWASQSRLSALSRAPKSAGVARTEILLVPRIRAEKTEKKKKKNMDVGLPGDRANRIELKGRCLLNCVPLPTADITLQVSNEDEVRRVLGSRRNPRAGRKREIPEETPPTSGMVRNDSHT